MLFHLFQFTFCLADVSDHLTVFCTIACTLPTSKELTYFRDFSHFNKDEFLQDLSHINFNNLVTNDVNVNVRKILHDLSLSADTRAPVRKASKQKRRQLGKPWISKAILTSLRKSLDNSLYSCGVFLDFSKAFDTVNHKILLRKMVANGIRGVPLKFFTSYI